MRRASWAAACVLVAAAFAAVAVAPAGGAANSKVTVKIAFHSGDPFFTGRLKSGQASCVPGRLVRVFRQQNSRRILFGADRSDSSGFWRLDLNRRMKPGGYVAVAKAKPGCLKGVSDPIAVGQGGPGGAG